MILLGKPLLQKLKKKNRGNTLLVSAIDKLIRDIESAKWYSKEEVLASRRDADCVNNEGFYIFNINIHRTMILLEFSNQNDSADDEEDSGVATIQWVGTHQEYESIFGNNKSTIDKWLRRKGLIE